MSSNARLWREKFPSFAGEPGYAYVRIPYDNMASRTELFGVPFYHIYISEGHLSANGYRQYSIRFKDVRHARNKWQHTTSSAPNIDTLHPRLEGWYERKKIGALRSEIYRNTRKVRLASAVSKCAAGRRERASGGAALRWPLSRIGQRLCGR
jgi:hypothetical protein